MKEDYTPFYQTVIENIKTIMKLKGLFQVDLAEYAEIDESVMSKILRYQTTMSLDKLSKIASGFQMREIDIISYPDILVASDGSRDPIEAILQIKLRKDKKDQVLRLIFGDNNIEILNK
jgi:transcriptional regulator with XRE-family HTH domain